MKKERILITIDKEVLEKLKAACAEKGQTVSGVIQVLIKLYLEGKTKF